MDRACTVFSMETTFVDWIKYYCKFLSLLNNEKTDTKKMHLHISMIFSVILNWCFTCWNVFHLESTISSTPIRFKLNQDLTAWWDMTGRNWIATILSHHWWCTWTTIINGQRIIAENINMFIFLIWQLKDIGTHKQLYASTSKDRKLISIVCPICTWISHVKSRLLS